jgi:hypothetical protein
MIGVEELTAYRYPKVWLLVNWLQCVKYLPMPNPSYMDTACDKISSLSVSGVEEQNLKSLN